MKAPSRPLLIALLGVLVVVVAAASVFAFQPDLADSVVLRLTGGSESVTSEGSAAPADGVTPKSETTPAAGTVDTASNTTGGSDTQGGTKPVKKPTGDTAKPAGMVVRILWWNDTRSKPADGFEIAFDSKSLKPDTSKASGVGSIGPCPVGEPLVLVVYPDGRGGKRFEVPFALTTSMEPDSDVDAIHVEVSDTKVRVLGNAVENFDQSRARF